MGFLNHFRTDSSDLVLKTIETFVFKYVKRAGLYNLLFCKHNFFLTFHLGNTAWLATNLFKCSHTTQLKNHRHRSPWLHHTKPTKLLSCQTAGRLANGERWAADTNNPGSCQKIHGRIKKGKEKCSETVTKPLKVILAEYVHMLHSMMPWPPAVG